MRAKDTVMTIAKYNQLCKAWHLENDVMELYEKIDFLPNHKVAMLQTQAEISFKAGTKEAERAAMERVIDRIEEIKGVGFSNEPCFHITFGKYETLKSELLEEGTGEDG